MGNPDEAMKNFAFHIAKEISNSNDVMHINAKENIFSLNFWSKFRNFQPHIVHIFLRPGVLTFLLSMILKTFNNNTKLIISSLQPPLNYSLIRMIKPFVKTDLVLVQSHETELILKKIGFKTIFLPSGVDIAKFSPVNAEARIALRKKYGIDEDKFIILHVGHINKGRNLSILNKLQKLENVQVVVVGSTNSFNFDSKVYNKLIENGCIVWRKYFDKLEEIYQLSDCYIFPTLNQNYCIEIPFSILEAMSCNLPVITTKFGALERIFEGGNGLFFVNSETKFINVLYDITNKGVNIQTRNKVIKYGWSEISHSLEKIYFEQVYR